MGADIFAFVLSGILLLWEEVARLELLRLRVNVSVGTRSGVRGRQCRTGDS